MAQTKTAEKMRALRAARRAAGQCVWCTAPNERVSMLCQAWNDAQNAGRRARRVGMSVTCNGITQSLEEWATQLGITPNAVRIRVHKYGNPYGLRADGTVAVQAGGFRSIEADGSWGVDAKARALVEEHGPLTLQQVADHMGCTRERVRQIEGSALRKLRNVAPHLEAKLRELDSLRDEADERCSRKAHVAVRRAS